MNQEKKNFLRISSLFWTLNHASCYLGVDSVMLKNDKLWTVGDAAAPLQLDSSAEKSCFGLR